MQFNNTRIVHLRRDHVVCTITQGYHNVLLSHTSSHVGENSHLYPVFFYFYKPRNNNATIINSYLQNG